MKPKMYDGVIVAVRYTPSQEIQEARMYLKRGFVYSDNVLVSRPELIEMLHKKKKIVSGRRVKLMATTFEDIQPVEILQQGSQEVITTRGTQKGHDHLEGIPLC